ncbi:glycosyltransferase family 4 protein [Candidatus Woesearchaeota archaeon]|nr:glycosyltransferase family 4 protein [Candidatus Woesearchaeota archaeon]
MKLGIFTDDFYPFIGGIGRHIYDLYYKNSKIYCIVFSPSDKKLKNHVIIKPSFHSKLKNIATGLFFQRNAEKLIHKYQLSKLNIHCGPGGIFFLKRVSIPVIATCHHTYWQQSHYIKSQFWKRIFIPFEKKTYQLADKIICVSGDSKNILVEKYNINKNKIVVIPNGVDTKQFYPMKNIKKIPNSLFYIGRLDKRKGIDFLVKSMPDIVKKNSKKVLYIGGKGKLMRPLQKFVTKNNLTNNVKFLGFIPDNKLNEWYNKMELVIVPSIFEGFGITVIEAMAAGTPVIGSNVDGIKGILTKQFLFNYGNQTDLIKKCVQEYNVKLKEKFNINNIRVETCEEFS